MLTDLIRQIGIIPKKASSTHGGVFHSSCPNCGGVDRFTIWNGENRYWCRGCEQSGDSIQFCRDFLGMSFSEARVKTGQSSLDTFYSCPPKASPPSFYVSAASPPPTQWKRKASVLVEHLHGRLLDDPKALEALYKRGLNDDTIRLNRLGYLGTNVYLSKEEWGLESDKKKLWVPAGHFIPFFGEDGFPFRIKIRKTAVTYVNRFGKYCHLTGGASNWMAIFGQFDHPTVILVESEFDAMLTIQEAGNLCCCVALGGATHRPDLSTYSWLKKKTNILFALDFDEAGKKAYPKWQSAFPQLIPFPVPRGKSPEEAHVVHKINLSQWIWNGLKANENINS